VTRKRLRRKGAPMTREDQHRLFDSGEDVPITEVIDMGARTAGIDPRIFEELTLADVARLGARIRKAPS
jgi:hypothetical protein